MRPDKDTIRRRFARAAATYDQQSVIQRRVAERLLGLLDRYPPPSPRRLLEIGCSTGILTVALARRYRGLATLYANDIVPEFEVPVREKTGDAVNLVFLPGDIETTALPADLDLVISSSTLHWLHDLPALLARLHERMTVGGILCFSLYGPENLRELRKVAGIGLDYFSVADLRKMVGSTFRVLACEEELLTVYFADPRTLLDHLRQTGVNALDPAPWTRKRLNDFIRQYRRCYGGPDGVVLTFHPVYCVAAREP
ncbi:MAG TPA: malonyl-[acyl-carrier protein] O-methyltransferase BioC [Desulfobacteraceae bacterium]|nr:malonyl-[acyl-carrier protein] O-methyltransferase BioC [Desulfobacteraceae bacterium]